jgi:hypothetical protein
MNARAPQTCSTCFTTTEFPGATIGEDGRCNFCKCNTLAERISGHKRSTLEALRKLVEEVRAGKLGKYDCIIGASGGFDSSYMLYLAKRELGLNPLAVKYDHGFNYDSGDENLKTICTALGVDLRIVASPAHRDVQYVRHILKAMRPADIYWGICSACHYVQPAAVAKIAAEEGIPMIISAYNYFEADLRVPRLFKLKFVLRSLAKVAPWRWPGILYHLVASKYQLFRLKLEYYIPPFGNLFRAEPRIQIRRVMVSEFIDWNVNKILDTLEALGWKSPVGRALPMRFDCMIDDSFMNYTFQKATGLHTHAIIANNLIYNGVRTKAELQETSAEYARKAATRVRQETQRILSGVHKT